MKIRIDLDRIIERVLARRERETSLRDRGVAVFREFQQRLRRRGRPMRVTPQTPDPPP